MSSLYVDRRNVHLKLDAGAIAFYENGSRSATVPLAPIKRVVLRGSITLEAGLMVALGAGGIGVLLLSGQRSRPALLLGQPHNDCTRRLTQIRQSLDHHFSLRYARLLVCSKLARQADWLLQLAQQHPQADSALQRKAAALQAAYRHAQAAGQPADLRKHASAAQDTYFDALRAAVPPALEFPGRNQNPPRDPFNALLSLSYTLVIAEAAMALHRAGLDPSIGFHHSLTETSEALACDLIEPLRPLVDRLCLGMVTEQTLNAEHFSTTSSGCLLGKAGRRLYYAAYEAGAHELRREIAQQIRALNDLLGLTDASSPQDPLDTSDGADWPWQPPAVATPPDQPT